MSDRLPILHSRRALLAGGVVGALSCLSGRARAFGEASRLSFAVLRHGGRYDLRPDALPRLSWEISKRTSIETTPIVQVLGAADPDLFLHPFAVLSCDGDFPEPGDAELAALRRYLSYGGFLLLDDASGSARGGPFELAARRLLDALLPGSKLSPVPRTHVVYKSFYLLDGPAGRLMSSPDLLGVELGGRLAVVLSPNDLLGALARDSFGTWELEVVPGGEPQRERSVRLGVNLVMYALCLDYKEDQVHIPFIMKRRRL